MHSVAAWITRNPDQGYLVDRPLRDFAKAALALIDTTRNVVALEIVSSADGADAEGWATGTYGNAAMQCEYAAGVRIRLRIGVICPPAAAVLIYRPT
jgi:hypothetical protein